MKGIKKNPVLIVLLVDPCDEFNQFEYTVIGQDRTTWEKSQCHANCTARQACDLFIKLGGFFFFKDRHGSGLLIGYDSAVVANQESSQDQPTSQGKDKKKIETS